MSSMAKIFVVVNLILGVVAFGSAATLLGAKEDYKAANAAMAKKFDEYKSSMTAKLAAAEKEKASQITTASTAVAAKQTAEAASEELKRRLADAEGANKKAQATIQNLTDQNKALTETNKTFTDTISNFSSEAKTATTDKLNIQTKWQQEVNNRVNLEKQVKNAAEENQALAAKLGDCEKELRNCKFWLDKYRERFGDITGRAKGQPGVVKQVRGNIVSISVGSGDGVRVGDVYQIRRGGTYVGQIKITNVYKDLAVGTFDDEYKGQGAPPMAGDAAEPGGY